jgi:hypothetical protein
MKVTAHQHALMMFEKDTTLLSCFVDTEMTFIKMKTRDT